MKSKRNGKKTHMPVTELIAQAVPAQRSTWYTKLSPADRQYVNDVALEAAKRQDISMLALSNLLVDELSLSISAPIVAKKIKELSDGK